MLPRFLAQTRWIHVSSRLATRLPRNPRGKWRETTRVLLSVLLGRYVEVKMLMAYDRDACSWMVKEELGVSCEAAIRTGVPMRASALEVSYGASLGEFGEVIQRFLITFHRFDARCYIKCAMCRFLSATKECRDSWPPCRTTTRARHNTNDTHAAANSHGDGHQASLIVGSEWLKWLHGGVVPDSITHERICAISAVPRLVRATAVANRAVIKDTCVMAPGGRSHALPACLLHACTHVYVCNAAA